MSKKSKHRDFMFLLYPDSIPDNWVRRLEELGIEMAISPLHDSDKREGKDLERIQSELEGQKIFNDWSEQRYAEELEKVIWKKPHYHVIYIAKNPVSAHAVRMRIQRRLGNDSVKKVKPIETSVKNVYDYLTHESKSAIEKGKHIYDKKDIKHLNGFDIANYITFSRGEERNMMNQLIELIYSRQIENYRELEDALREIETEREWRRRDKRDKQNKSKQNKSKPLDLTEEQEKEALDAAIKKRENEADQEVELEDETGELTLLIARQLYMKKPSAYIGMFNGNYQARMKREGGNPTPPK